MIERHYDEETLLTLIESDRAAADPHVPSCPECNGKLAGFRTIAGALAQRDVWDTRVIDAAPVPETIARLRGFANQMAHEDAQAELYLRDLLDGPREGWPAKLAAHPEYRTAGVVRKLLAAHDRAIDTMPPDAVAITALAIEIADHLAAPYSPDTLARLRGAAWRDHAYALFYTGQFSTALPAADRADAEFAHCTIDEYDRARVGIVKALVLRAFERTASAIDEALESANVFARSGDTRKSATVQFLLGHIRLKESDYRGARETFRSVELLPGKILDDETRARVHVNIAVCERNLCNIPEALRRYTLASEIFEELGVRTEAARVRWNVAELLLSEGQLDEASARLQNVAETLDELGMYSSAALARLSLAEILIVRGEHDHAEHVARVVMHSFAESGLAYSNRALTALSLLKEAVQARTVTPSLVRKVRQYVRELETQPDLLFAPLPD
ncbi:MAG TPA: hypothetical protein VF824_10055 [Thermoanaerobaculia bacterium]|jgi:tetratricopeptide (TPR) repeat protein